MCFVPRCMVIHFCSGWYIFREFGAQNTFYNYKMPSQDPPQIGRGMFVMSSGPHPFLQAAAGSWALVMPVCPTI